MAELLSQQHEAVALINNVESQMLGALDSSVEEVADSARRGAFTACEVHGSNAQRNHESLVGTGACELIVSLESQRDDTLVSYSCQKEKCFKPESCSNAAKALIRTIQSFDEDYKRLQHKLSLRVR